MLLVGPSNSGFTDPAQLISISLLQITSILINYAPTYERLVIMNALEELNGEIPIEFQKIQNDINREEKEKEKNA
jgi:hypothetical protein